MKRIYSMFVFALLISTTSCGQNKNTSGQRQTGKLDSKILSGKWRSESDSEYMLVFKNGRYVELYGKDTTDKMSYTLSGSCNLKDSASKINLEKSYLLFYSNDGVVQQCNEIMNLKSNILSWMNNTNGKIFVFRKVQ